MQQDTYTIKLNQFEGPFDLLLFFIERDELNIHDIPISSITEDFLAYIRKMESLNIDLASEFILVAATLMRIKAKLLIPRKEIDEEGNEIDPRDELVARLIEYKRYKGILEDMRGFEENRGKQFERGNISTEMKKLAERALIDAELESLTLFKLLKAFGNVLERMDDRKRKSVHQVYAYDYTIPNQQIFIFTKIREGSKTAFKEIFGNCENRMHAIITFLALLELLNMQKLRVTEGGDGLGVNVMVLEQSSHEDDVMTSHEGEDQEGDEDYYDDAEEGSARGGEMDEEPTGEDNENESIENVAADEANEIDNVVDANNDSEDISENTSGNEPGRAPDIEAGGEGRSEVADQEVAVENDEVTIDNSTEPTENNTQEPRQADAIIDTPQNTIEPIVNILEVITDPTVENISNENEVVEVEDLNEEVIEPIENTIQEPSQAEETTDIIDISHISIEPIVSEVGLITDPSIENISNENVVVNNESLIENTVPNQPITPINNALENMINSAVEVGATDLNINNTVSNISSEEE